MSDAEAAFGAVADELRILRALCDGGELDVVVDGSLAVSTAERA